MRIVGLSGGIACGKSTVSSMLRGHGIAIVDCDQIAHAVVKQGRWGYRRVVKAFGSGILLESGEIDRDRLGALVFGDVKARHRLNAATHLPVALELMRQLLWHWLTLKWVVVVDMPLLFETGSHRFMRPSVLVACSPDVQLQRLMQRDASSEAAARARISSQMPLESKRKLADAVLNNDGSYEELSAQVDRLAGSLKRGAAAWGLVTSPLAALAAGFALRLGLGAVMHGR